MSGAFIAGVKTHFTNSAQTVDWFHVVQLFTNAVKDVRLAEAKETSMPKASRWATLKNGEGSFTEAQVATLNELAAMDLETTKAWHIKEMLRWVRRAESKQAAKWRTSGYRNYETFITYYLCCCRCLSRHLLKFT
ncbi:MAG: transposase [Desulfobulbus sp.]|jgi:transposase|nr:transposase [Desulfobulbus sp.]